MTTPEWQDPFLSVPGAARRTPVPVDAPPPTGPLYSGHAPVGVPATGQTGWRAARPGGAPVPLPDWNALAPWKRTWGVTMRRWGYGWLVGIVAAMVAGVIAESAFGSQRWHHDPESMGYYAGSVAGVVLAYVIWVAWWLDHVIAGVGPRGVLVIHTLVASGLALVQFRAIPWIPPWYLPLLGLVVTPLAVLAAARVTGSFDSASGADGALR